jgi:hypothetical protein
VGSFPGRCAAARLEFNKGSTITENLVISNNYIWQRIDTGCSLTTSLQNCFLESVSPMCQMSLSYTAFVATEITA